MKTPSHILSVCLVSCLVAWGHPALMGHDLFAQTSSPSALRQISVEGSDTHAIVTLGIEGGAGEGAGALEEIPAPPFRLFIDLPNVIPQVASTTPVHKGGVDRVRVGLNQSSPPVTRVVLDLSRRSTYRLEEDPENHTLRIIIGTPDLPVSPQSVDATRKMSVYDEYAMWFEQTVGQVDLLLSDVETNAPDAWDVLRVEVEVTTPPSSLQHAHELLATAVNLGVVGTLRRADGRDPAADSAGAGARLFAARARALVRDASPRTAGVSGER